MTGGAIFSDDHRYRYLLWREWDPRRPRCCFVMLNPSTADAASDDATTRRCVDFAKRWGFGAVDLVNLFALRATDSRALHQAPAPIGPENDRWIARAHRRSARTVAAWGARGALLGRDERVGRLLARGARLHRFAQTKGGAPRHPLYLAATERTVRWAAAGRAAKPDVGDADLPAQRVDAAAADGVARAHQVQAVRPRRSGQRAPG